MKRQSMWIRYFTYHFITWSTIGRLAILQLHQMSTTSKHETYSFTGR